MGHAVGRRRSRPVVVLIAVLVLVACTGGRPPNQTATSGTASSGGLDPCALLEERDLQLAGFGWLLHPGYRDSQDDFARCGYNETPLAGGRYDHITTGPKAFLVATLTIWTKRAAEQMPGRTSMEGLHELPGVGDKAVTGKLANGATPDAWVLVGDRMIEFHFKRPENGKVPIDRLAKLMHHVVERLPKTIPEPTRDLRGRCAEIDLEAASRAGFRTDIASTTTVGARDVSCNFPEFELTVTHDVSWTYDEYVRSMAREDGKISIPGVRVDNFFWSFAEEGGGSYQAWVKRGNTIVHMEGGSSELSGPVRITPGADHVTIPPNLLPFLQTLPALLD